MNGNTDPDRVRERLARLGTSVEQAAAELSGVLDPLLSGGRVVVVTGQDLLDLSDVLSDCYAYRVGQGDPNDEDSAEIWPVARENMAKAKRLAELFGVQIY